jgi:hypothetical protein
MGAMRAYRLYYLDLEGHISGPPEIVECSDDHAAIEAAKARANGKVVEVWDLARVVIRLAPKR